MTSLGGVFIATLVGLGIAMIVLAFEVYFHKKDQKNTVQDISRNSGGGTRNNFTNDYYGNGTGNGTDNKTVMQVDKIREILCRGDCRYCHFTNFYKKKNGSNQNTIIIAINPEPRTLVFIVRTALQTDANGNHYEISLCPHKLQYFTLSKS